MKKQTRYKNPGFKTDQIPDHCTVNPPIEITQGKIRNGTGLKAETLPAKVCTTVAKNTVGAATNAL